MMKKSLFTILVFIKLNTKRFFRDKLALFFTVIFPLIFLLIFGAMSRGGDLSFKVGLINESDSAFAQKYVKDAKGSKLLKVDAEVKTLDEAKEKMKRGEIDATVVLPANFGDIKNGTQAARPAFSTPATTSNRPAPSPLF